MDPLESFCAVAYSVGLVTLGIMITMIAWFVFRALVLAVERIFILLNSLFKRKG